MSDPEAIRAVSHGPSSGDVVRLVAEEDGQAVAYYVVELQPGGPSRSAESFTAPPAAP